MKLQAGERAATEWVRQPATIILVATLICLASFWYSIHLPHKDGQLVGSDGISYYVYLPSVLLDGDLDLSNNYLDLQGYEAPEKQSSNYFFIGPAIFWAPFFLLGHVSALALNIFGAGISTNGCGHFHQAFVLSGSIIYGGLAMWFTYCFVRRLSAERSALYSVVFTIFAGNLVYYMTAEPSMSHTVSAFMAALLFDTLARRRGRQDASTAALYGLIGGTMALVRAQDGLMLAVPLLLQLWDAFSIRDMTKRKRRLIQWARNGLIAGAVALIAFIPQLLVWNHYYGGFARSPYFRASFSWFSPKLLPVLFSARRGLFVWHPIFLVAIAGLWYTVKRDRGMGAAGLFGFMLQWYIIASWYSWYQGEAFGGRMFIVCTPIFALGLAEVIHRYRSRSARMAMLFAGALLLIWNFLLFVEYRFDLAYQNGPPGWYDLTVGRIAFLLKRL